MRQPLGILAGALSLVTVMFVAGMATAPPVGAQAVPAAQTIDFVRDVQPIFRQSCYGCHGPSQQMNGFRLDRRSDAMRGGTIAVIGPGNSEGSRLYLYLRDSTFGRQMPPTGPLPPDQIATIKAWIDQGAVWPDEASGEEAPLPLDPDAVRLAAMIREGDVRGFRERLAREPKLANARGPGGATPLMFAALYGDVALLAELIDRGADVKARSDAGATALHWAAAQADKAMLLIQRGADVNAKSADGRTPLMIAAGAHGSAPTVKLLLERGVPIDAAGPSIFGQVTALTEAAAAGNEEVFRLLLAAGADPRVAGPPALGLAFRSGCMSCVETLMKAFPPELMTATMMMSAPPLGPALATPLFLERGASLDARDPNGRSILMLAAASDALPVDAVKALVARKMNVNDRTPAGETALGLARRHGNTPVVKLLLEAGARDEAVPPPPPIAPARSAREAIDRALPLLQKSDVTFLKKSGCVSCHNNSLTAMTLAAARERQVRFDEGIARGQTSSVGQYLESWRERTLQGLAIPGEADTVSYILLGLAADNYPADLATDAQAILLKRVQAPDGRWRILANRPPIESSDIQVTAASMRALQRYAPPGQRAEFDKAVAAAAAWLRSAAPRVTEDHAFRLLGLQWSNAPQAAIEQAGQALVAEQRADGGWAQLPTMESDAYATGQALVALIQSGAITKASPAYQRGAAYLLKTQLADGSWFVKTRALPIQPLFNADFPHGANAFISAAATNWATTALMSQVR